MKTPVAHDTIMEISPYVGGTSKLPGFDKVVKLSSNEGAFGVNPNVVEAIRSHAELMFRYPDGSSQELREAIAKVHNLDKDKILCGTGSDNVIDIICEAFSKDGDDVIMTQYGFSMYRVCAKGNGANVIEVPEKNYTVDLDAVLSAITNKTKIIFITNPGNPTGTYLPKKDLYDFCKKVPSNILIVLDSAYAEYVPCEDYTAGAEFVEEFNNVIMLRTFSKIYALGGLRIGWSYASKEIIDVFNRIRAPFNVNTMAQYAGVVAMQDREFVKKCFEHNKKWQKKFPEELSKIGLNCTPTVANFVLVHFPKTGKTSEKCDEFLKQHGYIVRRVLAYGLKDELRITIGNEEEMTTLVSLLKEFMEK
ncbi:MAG: histidinol-phosphate transaminase [Alphaproteobacteria bacterium]|nr:histidinol-phosphate transaminase [Alphaproteobacteria bacterium]